MNIVLELGENDSFPYIKIIVFFPTAVVIVVKVPAHMHYIYISFFSEFPFSSFLEMVLLCFFFLPFKDMGQ